MEALAARADVTMICQFGPLVRPILTQLKHPSTMASYLLGLG